MNGRPLSEIVAWQWAQTNEQIIRDLSKLPRAEWTCVSYESLLNNPGQSLEELCEFAGIPYGPRIQAIAKEGFAVSRYTLTAPKKDKWKRHEREILAASRLYSEVAERLSSFP